MKITTYDLLLLKIKKGGYDKENLLQMLDAYLLGGRITLEQYQELTGMIGAE